MKRPSFIEGVGVAIALSVTASVAFHALGWIAPGAWALHLLIAAVALGYVVYLLMRSPGRVGRISTLGLWAIATLATLSIEPSLALHLLVQVGLVWLIRSLYFYSSVLAALADLGLSGLGLSAALWAAERSGSLFLSLWCLLLVQALFVAIPPHLRRKRTQIQPQSETDERFERAHRTADNALRRLSTLR